MHRHQTRIKHHTYIKRHQGDSLFYMIVVELFETWLTSWEAVRQTYFRKDLQNLTFHYPSRLAPPGVVTRLLQHNTRRLENTSRWRHKFFLFLFFFSRKVILWRCCNRNKNTVKLARKMLSNARHSDNNCLYSLCMCTSSEPPGIHVLRKR